MDPLAQAFAYYDFPYPEEELFPGLDLDARRDLGQLSYTAGVVDAKYLINDATFPTGYITVNNHWTNYWRLGDNSARIGWRSPAGNSGATDMALNPAYAEGDGATIAGTGNLPTPTRFPTARSKGISRGVPARARAQPGGFGRSGGPGHHLQCRLQPQAGLRRSGGLLCQPPVRE